MFSIDNINWHDGLLESITISMSSINGITRCIDINVRIYITSDAIERSLTKLHFTDVENVVLNCDLLELQDNISAGNISNGYLKQTIQGQNLLRIYLIDGYIEIIYGGVSEAT